MILEQLCPLRTNCFNSNTINDLQPQAEDHLTPDQPCIWVYTQYAGAGCSAIHLSVYSSCSGSGPTFSFRCGASCFAVLSPCVFISSHLFWNPIKTQCGPVWNLLLALFFCFLCWVCNCQCGKSILSHCICGADVHTSAWTEQPVGTALMFPNWPKMSHHVDFIMLQDKIQGRYRNRFLSLNF